MGNDYGRAALPGLVQSLLDYLLTLSVQGRSGFIKEENLWVTDQSPSNSNPLLLSSTQLGALGTNIGIVTLTMQMEWALLIITLRACARGKVIGRVVVVVVVHKKLADLGI